MSRQPTTASGTADYVGWDFVLSEYRRRIPEPKTWAGLDKTNARIRAWRLLQDFDPSEAERVA